MFKLGFMFGPDFMLGADIMFEPDFVQKRENRTKSATATSTFQT